MSDMVVGVGRELEKLAVAYRQSGGKDSRAFEQIYHSLRGEMIGWTREKLVVQQNTDAEGIVDLAFAELNQFLLDKSRPIAPIRPWLYSYLWRRIPMERRWARRKKRGGGASHAPIQEHLVPENAPEVAEVAGRNEAIEMAKSMWPSFPEREQEVLAALYEGAGMTHEEAAEYLNIPLGTLKTRWRRAIQRMQERLCAA